MLGWYWGGGVLQRSLGCAFPWSRWLRCSSRRTATARAPPSWRRTRSCCSTSWVRNEVELVPSLQHPPASLYAVLCFVPPKQKASPAQLIVSVCGSTSHAPNVPRHKGVSVCAHFICFAIGPILFPDPETMIKERLYNCFVGNALMRTQHSYASAMCGAQFTSTCL